MTRLHVWRPTDLQAGIAPPALLRLLQAHRYAHDSQADPWQFAVALDEFLAVGATPSDLRWLVSKGYAAHGVEVTTPQDATRRFRLRRNLAFEKRTCFVLTEAGVRLAEPFAPPAAAPLPGAQHAAPVLRFAPAAAAEVRPHWDARRRALSLGGRVVKCYRRPSTNQELILGAFEEDGWPARIDDPLPPQPGQDPKGRLHDTIKRLNRHHAEALLRFVGDGTGTGVCWQLAPQATPPCRVFSPAQPLRRAA